MHFLKVAALALFPLVLSSPAPRETTGGTIIAPADGTVIAPGETFAFEYSTMADYGARTSFVTSYNYTVFLLTSVPTTFAQSVDFAQGHYFGRFAEPNYPGNPSPKNVAPTTLTMPDFSKSEGGFGTGAVDSNGDFALVVMEEYGNGDGSVGSRLALAINGIKYNATSS